jgi:hypothetical protein
MQRVTISEVQVLRVERTHPQKKNPEHAFPGLAIRLR